ncbi:acylphosphatase [Flexithrix dorotheae]|uniref:acylphosphatase n=1 Tax=Flexithrix dorotheae TaxID=70993 RepID=UPI00035E6FD3|nr:acylphosphatase [Flexithrix dorotheae]
MVIHIGIKVEGKVQGVFYRATTQKKANALGIKGTVKNQEDGSVYIEAEGEETILNEFVEWCKKGPLLAKVASVQTEKKELQNYNSFEIVYS